MEKKREQELADQETLRLYREFTPRSRKSPWNGKSRWTR